MVPDLQWINVTGAKRVKVFESKTMLTQVFNEKMNLRGTILVSGKGVPSVTTRQETACLVFSREPVEADNKKKVDICPFFSTLTASFTPNDD